MVSASVFPTLLFFFTFFFISTATDTLTSSNTLSDGQTLISANGTFALGFFSPPNTTNRYLGIWFHSLAVQTIVWVANRRNPIHDLNATLSITPYDASLHLITSGNSTPIWSSSSFPTNSFRNPIVQLLDSGNLVVKYANSSSFLWQSFNYPTDILLAGMKLGRDLKNGIDRCLTAWMSPSDPSPGNYTFAIDTTGIPQLVIRTASGNWLWRGGPWTGLGFSGAGPDQFFDIALYQDYNSVLHSTPEEIYYLFNNTGDAISTVSLNYNGTSWRSSWQASAQMWDVDRLLPSEPCDFFPACGTNAVCDSSSSPMCRCLDGFYPKDPVSWGIEDWSDGCSRATVLDCEKNGTDEFMVVRGAKLPDTAAGATEDMSVGLDACRARCLMNCSCNAYASANLNYGGSGCIIWTADIMDIRLYAHGGQDLYVRLASRGNGK